MITRLFNTLVVVVLTPFCMIWAGLREILFSCLCIGDIWADEL